MALLAACWQVGINQATNIIPVVPRQNEEVEKRREWGKRIKKKKLFEYRAAKHDNPSGVSTHPSSFLNP